MAPPTKLEHDQLLQKITARIALGPRAGQKAFTLQSLPGTSRREPDKPFLASADGTELRLNHEGMVLTVVTKRGEAIPRRC